MVKKIQNNIGDYDVAADDVLDGVYVVADVDLVLIWCCFNATVDIDG